jgi:hypothetical protein
VINVGDKPMKPKRIGCHVVDQINGLRGKSNKGEPHPTCMGWLMGQRNFVALIAPLHL